MRWICEKDVKRIMTKDELLKEHTREIEFLNSLPEKREEICSIFGRIMQVMAEYGYEGIPENEEF